MISFLAGLVISGYVVEISIIQGLNKWHLLSILVGVVIGLLCIVLDRISKNFEDNERSFAKNLAGKSSEQVNKEAWISINLDTDENRILKLLPKFWVPLTTTLLPTLLLIGILSFYYANIELKETSLNESQIQQYELVSKVDSLLNNQYKVLKKNKVLNDSIDILIHKISFQAELIDSLLNGQSSSQSHKNKYQIQKKQESN